MANFEIEIFTPTPLGGCTKEINVFIDPYYMIEGNETFQIQNGYQVFLGSVPASICDFVRTCVDDQFFVPEITTVS